MSAAWTKTRSPFRAWNTPLKPWVSRKVLAPTCPWTRPCRAAWHSRSTSRGRTHCPSRRRSSRAWGDLLTFHTYTSGNVSYDDWYDGYIVGHRRRSPGTAGGGERAGYVWPPAGHIRRPGRSCAPGATATPAPHTRTGNGRPTTLAAMSTASAPPTPIRETRGCRLAGNTPSTYTAVWAVCEGR